MAIPRTPHRSALSLFDVNRIPNRTPRVIVSMNLFYWHQDLLSVTRNVAQKKSRSNRFTNIEPERFRPVGQGFTPRCVGEGKTVAEAGDDWQPRWI